MKPHAEAVKASDGSVIITVTTDEGTWHLDGAMPVDDWSALNNAAQSLADAEECLAAAKDAARSALFDAIKHGISESEAARILGVNRLTVRAWLGK